MGAASSRVADRASGAEVLWLTGAGLALVAVSYGLARFAYGLFVPAFRAEFALDVPAAGTIAAGSYVSYCVAVVVSTVLSPRYGARVVAVAAGCLATAGTLVIAAAPSAAVLAVGVVLGGASTGVASPPLAQAVARSVAAPARDRVQTVVNAGTGVGVAVAGPVALVLQDQWRAAWLAFAVLCALVTVGVARAVPSGRGPSGPASGTALLPRPLLPAGSGRLLLAAALLGAGSAATWTFGRDLLVEEGAVGASASLLAWLLLGAFGVLGAGAGDLATRSGIESGWLVTMLALAAATGALAAVPGSVPVACTAAAAFGASYIAASGLLLVWGTRVYPHAPASGVGLAFLVLAVGQAVGAPLVGAVAGVLGPRLAFTSAALVAVVGALVRPGSSLCGEPARRRDRSSGRDAAR